MDWKKLLNSNRLRETTRRITDDARNHFESDFGRIIFSPALRRMHDKTQVFPLTADDNMHSRLTHSLEVMSIGFSLGIKLAEDETFQNKVSRDEQSLIREIPTILKNCCLLHDIGNPPFGHFGETIIQVYFTELFEKSIVKTRDQIKQEDIASGKQIFELTERQKNDFLNYDGNAQGLRVITKLQILNDTYGLNLTYATLGSYIKYPNFDKIDSKKIAKKKLGVFDSEVDIFNKIAKECGIIKEDEFLRHPLCFLMEAADSICYLTMDIEDGIAKKILSLADYVDELKKLNSINEQILEIFEGKDNDITKIVKIRILLIQYLVSLASKNFIKNLDAICEGTYNKELIEDDETNLAHTLRKICSDKIFSNREINSLEITGHSVIKGLLDYYISFLFHKNKKYRKRASSLISKSILKIAFAENSLLENSSIDDLNDYYKLRIIVDFISGMTDQFALDQYQKISGQKIS